MALIAKKKRLSIHNFEKFEISGIDVYNSNFFLLRIDRHPNSSFRIKVEVKCVISAVNVCI